MPDEPRKPRKPRVFKEFVIDELSAVDIPAQQPALIAIRKAKDGEQLSDRIEDPSLSDEEKKKLAAKLNPNYGKGFLGPGRARLVRRRREGDESSGRFARQGLEEGRCQAQGGQALGEQGVD